MEVKITIQADLEDESDDWNKMKRAVDQLIGTTEGSNLQIESNHSSIDPDISENEQAVLKAIRNKPGYALRTIHEQVAEQDDSQFDDYTGEWDEDRKKIQELIYSLESKGLVSNRKRSWYPVGHPKVN